VRGFIYSGVLNIVQRYYTASAGRFYTPDPAGMKGADPKDPATWNMYVYAKDDPVNFNDPKGGLPCWIAGFGPGGGGNDGGSGCIEDPCDFLIEAFGPVPSPLCGYPGPAYEQRGGSSDCIEGFPAEDVGFVVANYADAVALGSKAGVPQFWVLGWSALESYWGTRGIVLSNGNYIGWSGSGDVPCPPSANKGFGCFSGFDASLNTALFSTSNYFKYGGQQYHIPAGTILSDQFGKGASVQSAFDTLAHAGYTPDQGYGLGVSSRSQQVIRVEACLRRDGILP